MKIQNIKHGLGKLKVLKLYKNHLKNKKQALFKYGASKEDRK